MLRSIIIELVRKKFMKFTKKNKNTRYTLRFIKVNTEIPFCIPISNLQSVLNNTNLR